MLASNTDTTRILRGSGFGVTATLDDHLTQITYLAMCRDCHPILIAPFRARFTRDNFANYHEHQPGHHHVECLTETLVSTSE